MSVLLKYSTQFLLAGDGFSSTQAHDNISATQVWDGLGQADLAQNLQKYWISTAVDGWRKRDSFFRGLMFQCA
jgi:hypothetical protein